MIDAGGMVVSALCEPSLPRNGAHIIASRSPRTVRAGHRAAAHTNYMPIRSSQAARRRLATLTSAGGRRMNKVLRTRTSSAGSVARDGREATSITAADRRRAILMPMRRTVLSRRHLQSRSDARRCSPRRRKRAERNESRLSPPARRAENAVSPMTSTGSQRRPWCLQHRAEGTTTSWCRRVRFRVWFLEAGRSLSSGRGCEPTRPPTRT